MNQKLQQMARALFALAAVITPLLAISCATPSRGPVATKNLRPAFTLNVALYPYVPDPEYVQQVVQAQWGQLVNAPTLNFVSWDCYSSNPPPSIDVFVFDAIFLSNFADAGFLRPFQPNEIFQPGDFLPYATNGCVFNGQFFGIPQIGCTDMLYYRDGDQQMAQVQTLSDLWNVLGPAQYTYARPPNGVGFMMDFSGGTTDACEYISTAELQYNSYTTNPLLPSASNLDPTVMQNLCWLVQMAGPAQAAFSDDLQPYIRGTWFDAGSARAMVGFTEAMSAMPTIQNSVQFKVLPKSNGANFSLFYLDVAGVNANVTGTEKEGWAVSLANVITSEAVISKAFAGRNGPQYLMPVRTSVFNTLGGAYPQYARMQQVVQNANPQAFRLGPASRNWLNASKSGIKQQILGMAGCQDVPKDREKGK